MLFFTICTILRVWIAARRTMRQYRTVPAEELPAHLRRLLTCGSDGDFLDCKSDIEFAGKFIRMVLFEILGLPGERQLRIDYQGT